MNVYHKIPTKISSRIYLIINMFFSVAAENGPSRPKDLKFILYNYFMWNS